MPIIKTTDFAFETLVLKANNPVLLEFTATWCGPSKAMAPMLEQLSRERSGITIGKLDVDDNTLAPAKYGVRGIPTFMIFKNGAPVSAKAGLLSKPQIEAWIDATI